MKNIHLLPADKPSRLFLNKVNNKLLLDGDTYSNLEKILPSSNYQHLYITGEEEIKEGDWFYCFQNNNVLKCFKKEEKVLNGYHTVYKKIILTTDTDLIKDGVQKIDDEFLEWFVKNPSCESVDVNYELGSCLNCEWNYDSCPNSEECLKSKYNIIIPKEEPKDVVLGYKTSIDNPDVEYFRNKLFGTMCKGLPKKYFETTDLGEFDKEKAESITRVGQKLVRELQRVIEQKKIEEEKLLRELEGESDDLPTTTSDLIDRAIWELPIDDRMKVWNLIEQLVKEEISTLYTEEEVRKAIDLARVFYKITENDGYDEFKHTPIEIIQLFKKK